MEKVIESFTDVFTSFLKTLFIGGAQKYGDFLFGLFIGLGVAWLYHKYLGYQSVKRSYENTIKAKDESISLLKQIVNDRLSKVVVQEVDKSFFKKLKKFFK